MKTSKQTKMLQGLEGYSYMDSGEKVFESWLDWVFQDFE